jgi:ABC-type sugar transport system ATPase subunit
MVPDATPLLLMQGISKAFPGVQALNQVGLDLYSGEVLALLGENGAGKSTLIKMLGGAHQPDEGDISIDGSVLAIHSPQDALSAGIAVIYQEFNLVPWLSARENIFLGQEPSRVGFLPAGRERKRAVELFQQLGVEINPDTLCIDLTVAEQQIVEIAKALSMNARIIVMDEPSAALSTREVEGLFKVVEGLKERGMGVIYISHRLDEIFEVADRVTFLRDGEHVGTRSISDLTREDMIELMVGRSIDQEFPKVAAEIGDVRIACRGMNRGKKVQDVSLEVRRGEILGLTGLVGSGRTETARLLFGADEAESGTMTLDGKELRLRNPRDAISAGICLLTEDRKAQGLVLGQTILENFGLANLDSFSRYGWIDRSSERSAMLAHGDRLQIKMTGPGQVVATLSGGNQQKVVLAKWLERNAEVLIFDEPTRGIDVGAKYEIYQLMNRLAAQGKAILMISSELPEVLGMCDRIVVMHEGRISGEIQDVASATQSDILRFATATYSSET